MEVRDQKEKAEHGTNGATNLEEREDLGGTDRTGSLRRGCSKKGERRQPRREFGNYFSYPRIWKKVIKCLRSGFRSRKKKKRRRKRERFETSEVD